VASSHTSLLPSRQSEKRTAVRNSCDVQEQPVSGVQPELGEHELKGSEMAAPFGRGISVKAGRLSASWRTTILPPEKKGFKGNEFGGGIPWLRRPFARQARIDLNHDEECKGVGGLSGMKMPIFKRSAVPDNPPRGTPAPEANSHKTQHDRPF
jgi:hypothetical protein